MKTDWKERADTLDALIRSGNIVEARAAIERIDRRTPIPRSLVSRYAGLARRAGLPRIGIRWLRPIVRPPEQRLASAEDAEKIEYAACLIRLGALSEALGLLAPIDTRVFPRAAFERAAALVAEWRYAESIPLLDAFIRHPRTPPYEKITGQLNLAAALVYEEHFRRSTPLLRSLLHLTSVRRDRLLLGHVYHLAAQAAIARQKPAEAKRLLDSAEKALASTREPDRFFFRKWRAFLALQEKHPDAREKVEAIRREAERLGQCETCRDCDRVLALELGNEALLKRVYFGTPRAEYRERLLADFGRKVEIPASYVRCDGAGVPERVLDLTKEMTVSPVRYRALFVLASDFYRPLRSAAFFQEVHPGERYHPKATADRVHQLIRSLRKWLSDRAPGIHLTESGGDFRLVLSPGWGIRVPLVGSAEEIEPKSMRLKCLRNAFGNESFDSRAAATVLGASPRSVLRVLADGIQDEHLEKSGAHETRGTAFAVEKPGQPSKTETLLPG